MSNEFLLEIYAEDIPPSYLQPSVQQLQNLIEKTFNQHQLKWGEIRCFYTPRRIAVQVNQLPLKQSDQEQVVKGPSLKFSYHQQKPTKALQGFLKKHQAKLQEVFHQNTPKGDFVFIKKVNPGLATSEILRQNIPQWIGKINFPKTMRWESSNFKFARPIRNILALFQNQVIPVNLAGVSSTDQTFISHLNDQKIKVTLADYEKVLHDHNIIIDFKMRKEMLEKMLQEMASKHHAQIYPDPQLVDTVTNLLEYPVVMWGTFPQHFLKLPPEVITTALRYHQKDFSVLDKNNKLMPCFIAVADRIDPRYIDQIVKGNEKVVISRLEDAYFYYHDDVKHNLVYWAEQLSQMTYQQDLGTLKDKTDRLMKLVLFLKDQVNSDVDSTVLQKCAQLSKADMATSMIRDGKEFTSLQGTIGKYYALQSGESESVAIALEEQYYPQGTNGKIPETEQGSILSLADKMDHLIGFSCAAGLPTGSADPYGIRKAANAIIATSIHNQWHIHFKSWVNFNLELYHQQHNLETFLDSGFINDFFKERIKNYLKERDYRYDVVNAAVEYSGNDPLKSLEITRELSNFREDENFLDLVIGYKRASRILENQKYPHPPDPDLIKQPEEIELYQSIQQYHQIIPQLLLEKKYAQAIEKLLELKTPIDNFFDHVMVNVEDDQIRENRKKLLFQVVKIFHQLACLDEIVVEGEEKDR
ncbi:MAG: glycine--tRNA ligase subunit beta [bacterium]